MAFSLGFSCDLTVLDIKEWSAKGYEIELRNRPDYGENKQLVTVTKTSYTDDNDMPIIDTFKYMMMGVVSSHGKVVIPRQDDVIFETTEHPRKDECVFLNLKDVNITRVAIIDPDDDSKFYRCNTEDEFVLHMLMDSVGEYVPFTQKWQDFYKEYGELAGQIVRNNRLMLENQMKLLMKLKLNCWN